VTRLLPPAFGSLPAGLRRERVHASPQFHDDRFENTTPVSSPMNRGQMWSTTREYFFGARGVARRPSRPLPVEDPRAGWATSVASGLRVTWLGHSTTLLEIDGFRVLTDPVWGERVSPVGFVGPRRFHPAPVAIEELPELDAILISHDHFDHLDYPSVRALAKLDAPFVTSLGVGAHLEAWGVPATRIHELDWWESAAIGGLRFHALPARHFSGRGFGTTNATLWSSWTIEAERHRVFFSGDTGLTPEFGDVGRRFGSFDLIMLEVGAYHPAWGSIHLGPDNALAAQQLLGGGLLMPVHWGTFDLALHAWDQPAERLVERAGSMGVRLVTPRLGRPVEPSRVEGADPWWRQVGPSLGSSLDASNENSPQPREGLRHALHPSQPDQARDPQDPRWL
jgi:L-ascorbate metabolism protein UlaG (beta-lactamase superfamily)